MKCNGCSRTKELVARGYCAACYQRWHKTGITEYQRWGKRSICSVTKCGKQVVSNGLCDTHRKRLERHNDIEKGRPDSWGAVDKHPLRNSWKWMKRHEALHPIDPAWSGDFLQFAVDVGERPSSKHKLFSADSSKPIGPDNFVWKRAITEKVDGEDDKTYKNRVQKVYRALRPDDFRDGVLKNAYGISLERFKEMRDSQNGVCAICGKPETMKFRGVVASLSIDHCHKSGSVRGLLCSSCNRGIGILGDSPERLRAAADYIERAVT